MTDNADRLGDTARPIEQQSVVELVLAEVRRLILDGSLPAGAPLSITDLANRLQVSHIAVRELLRLLEGECLVELRRSRSAVVAQLSTNDLEGIFHLRAVLESEIMARATKVYTDADIAWIQAAWAALERRPEDNAETLSERHIEFHRRLYLPAMNDWDRRLGDIVWQASDRYMYLILGSAMPMDDPMHFRDVHTELLEAARARSARMARRAVAEHLRSGVELLAAHLDAAAGSQLPETAV